MISEKDYGKCWNCPSDRELVLRAKLNSGWSIHTGNLFQKIETIPLEELQAIENVIQRAKQIEKLEVERVGRMVCRLENMTRNTLGDGKKTCSMCGIAFGFFSSFVHCIDCEKAVCEKCRVDTLTPSAEYCVLCKICSENREVWKKSGGWFYGRLPSVSEDCQKECISQVSGSPSLMTTWEHRARDIVRLESFEPPEENHNDNSQYKDWTMTLTPDIVGLESFEPPEEDHNDNSQYKDWIMTSTPDLKSLEDEEENGADSHHIELEPSRKRSHDFSHLDMNYLTVQSTKLSASCPSLTELQETPKLIRKASIRRKKKSPGAKIISKIRKAM